jgi:beta-phosphoglucomutase
MIKGVLFDMDGVLVDSESYINRAAVMMFEEMGVRVDPEDFRPFTGMGENSYIGGVAKKYNVTVNIEKVKARTYEIYKEITMGNLSPLPGTHEFISECRKRDLRLALATSADRKKVEINLPEIGLSFGVFHSIITGQDIENKKPFPDIYIKAAGSIGLKPAECLVVEDSISGIKAGRSAGCKCLAVTTSFDASLLSEADWIFESLLEINENIFN